MKIPNPASTVSVTPTSTKTATRTPSVTGPDSTPKQIGHARTVEGIVSNHARKKTPGVIVRRHEFEQ
jgi:hypothetical protein